MISKDILNAAADALSGRSEMNEYEKLRHDIATARFRLFMAEQRLADYLNGYGR